MTLLHPRRPALRLEQQSFQELREQGFERDGWRYQQCGCLSELQLHHFQRRNLLGDDAEENLITPCAECHQQAHLRTST
jgi:5-methylcytosine-specific restriction endonuclease McrA